MNCDCQCHQEPNPYVSASYAEDVCGLCSHHTRPRWTTRQEVIFLLVLVVVLCAASRWLP